MCEGISGFIVGLSDKESVSPISAKPKTNIFSFKETFDYTAANMGVGSGIGGIYVARKLWFVTNGVQVIAVFDQKDGAIREMERYQDDPDYSYYDCYDLEIDELDNYPDEYDLALVEGFIS